MAKIKQLLGSDEKVFFPQTHQRAVIDENGNSLVEVFKEQHDEALEYLDEKFTEVHERITEVDTRLTNEVSALRNTHANRLRDLEQSLFHIDANLTPNQTIYRRGSTSYEDCYVDIRLNTNHPDMLNREGLLNRQYLLEGSTKLTSNSTGVTFNPGDPINQNTTRVRFRLAETDSTGYASYKLSFETKAGWADGTNPNNYSISFKSSTSTEFIQVAPSYIGWSSITQANGNIITDRNSILREVWNTDISGIYTYSKVPKNYLFWIIVPKSDKFFGYSSVSTNNVSVLMTNYIEQTINGVKYYLISNASGVLQVGDLDWKIVLE